MMVVVRCWWGSVDGRSPSSFSCSGGPRSHCVVAVVVVTVMLVVRRRRTTDGQTQPLIEMRRRI